MQVQASRVQLLPLAFGLLDPLAFRLAYHEQDESDSPVLPFPSREAVHSDGGSSARRFRANQLPPHLKVSKVRYLTTPWMSKHSGFYPRYT